jgi:hypothetical protein
MGASHPKMQNEEFNMVMEDRDRFGVAEGARKLAVDIVIRALVEHASASDPGLRDRIVARVDDFIESIGSQSELEDEFAERARSCASALVRPLTSP